MAVLLSTMNVSSYVNPLETPGQDDATASATSAATNDHRCERVNGTG